MLTYIDSLDQTVVFIVFVSVMVFVGIVLYIINERDVRRKQKLVEEEIARSRIRMAEYREADRLHLTAVEALFKVQEITKKAIADIEKEKAK